MKNIFFRLFFGALVMGGLLSPSHAQRYSFAEASAGLGNLNVNDIAQDSSGYLWVGTENGLYQYDGRRFMMVGAARGLHARTIQGLLALPDGTLLVGSTQGIFFRMPNGTFAEILPPASASKFSLRIGSIFAVTGPGRIAVTDGSSLYELRRVTPFQWTATLLYRSDVPVWSVLQDHSGVLWFGCGEDLCRLEKGRAVHVGATLHLPVQHWIRLQLDKDRRLWLRGGKHIGEIDPTRTRYTERPLPGHDNGTPYDALSIDKQGNAVAALGPSFGIWHGNGWRMVTQRNGFPRNDISNVLADREGSLWFAVIGHGLLRWVGQDHWESFTTAEGLSDNILWATVRDRAGRLWIGTESGLDWMEAGSTSIRHWRQNGIPSTRSVGLARDASGNIWMGSSNGNLVRIDARTLAGRSWKIPEVYQLLAGPDHRLWIATGTGLYWIDTDTARPEPHRVASPAIANPKIRFRSLCFDPQGKLWAASDDALYRLDHTGWTRITVASSKAAPQQIAVDRNGNLWGVGSFPGLVRLRIDGNRIIESEHILRPHLLSEQIIALTVDSRGWLWVGQDAGVTVFDGSKWRNYDQHDGLIWNDLDAFAIYEDTDGSMWLGSSGGLSHLLHPAAIPPVVPSRPTIEQISFGSTDLTAGAAVRWTPSPLTITLTALNFRDAHHLRIRYRLLGLESEWIETTEETMRYPRLAPGHYTFQAETLYASGNSVSPTVSIAFRIMPRWWQTWLFRATLFVISLAALAILWRWRVRRLIAQKRLLQIAVLEHTRELEREKVELLHAREQMRHFAEHDDLTGLLNHRLIIGRLRAEIARARRHHIPLSVVMIDLDFFKAINDSYGHQTGDAVLRELGRILLRSIRSYDWVGRYGGEEFLLILPGADFSATRLRAEQLRSTIQQAEIQDSGHSIRITASLGAAAGLPDNDEAMIRIADAALYLAKANGRNCVVVSEISPSAETDSTAADSDLS